MEGENDSILRRLPAYARSPRGRTLIVSFLAIGVLLWIWAFAGSWYQQQLLKENRAQVDLEISLRSNALSAAINRRLALLEGIEAFVQASHEAEDFEARFETYVASIFESMPGIRYFVLGPGGVIQYVYPREGNEALLGYEPSKDPRPAVRADLQRAIITDQPVVSGPTALVPGGQGLIARKAIEVDGRYWGFTHLVLDIEPIYERAGFNNPEVDLDLALQDDQGRVYFGEVAIFGRQPSVGVVELPPGNWRLAGIPMGGWEAASRREALVFQGAGLLIVALLAGTIYLSANRQIWLSQAVQERTREISQINQQLEQDILERQRAEAALRASEARQRALLNAIPDLIFRLSRAGDILDAHGVPPDDPILKGGDGAGMNVRDLPMEPQVIDEVLAAIEQALDRDRIRNLEFDFTALDEPRSYETRLVRSGPEEVVAIVRDITERKQTEAALREREGQYRQIFERVHDGLFINDLEGNLVAFNPAAHQMHGYTAEEFSQLHPTQFVHPGDHPLFAAFIETVRSGQEYQCRATDLRKDGTPFPVEVYGTPFTYRGKPHGLAVVRDITEQVQAFGLLEKRVEERTRELLTLLQISQNVASTLELKPLLDLVLDQLQKVVDYTGSSVFTLEEGVLVAQAYRGPAPREVVLAKRFRLDESIIDQEIFSRREPVIIHDVRGDEPLALAFQESAGAELETTFAQIRSWMGVPLIVKDRQIGNLAFDHHQPGFYQPHHARLAMAFANQAAVAIENARLYEQAHELASLQERQKLSRELHDSVSQALYGIALGVRTVQTLLERAPDPEPDLVATLREPLEYVVSLSEAGLTEMRALIFELRPDSLEMEGLVAALQKQVAALQARYRIPVEADLPVEPPVGLDIKQSLYRIALEALHNTVKHAQASQVSLRLEMTNGWLNMQIQDDGVGFDPSQDFPGHLGLRSMRERVERLRGVLKIESGPGKGTRIQVRLPSDS